MRRKRVRKLPHPEDLEALGFVLELLAHPNEGAARGLCRPLSFAEAVAMLEEEAATPGISLGDIETRLPVATEAYIKRLQRLRKAVPDRAGPPSFLRNCLTTPARQTPVRQASQHARKAAAVGEVGRVAAHVVSQPPSLCCPAENERSGYSWRIT